MRLPRPAGLRAHRRRKAERMIRSIQWLVVVSMILAAGTARSAEDLDFHAPANVAGPTTAAAMRSLALRALPVYANPNRASFLANLSALQMVAGEFAAADATRRSLQELREREKTARPVDLALIYDLYARARALSGESGKPFAETFAAALSASLEALSDPNALQLGEWLNTPLSVYQANLQRDFDRLHSRRRITLDEAIDLAWAYVSYEAFHSFGPLVGKLIAADNARRYIEQDVEVAAPHRIEVSAVVIRPKSLSTPLPALLELTEEPGARERARECAARGYAGVVANPAASGAAPSKAHLRGREAAGSRALIEWIARQKWSDGRVGLYGSGASAFAAWRAAQRPPRALAALAASSPAVAPTQAHRLERLGRGRRPRRKAAPTSLAVLATTGYFDVNESASLAWLAAEHRRHPQGRERLLIGPYDSQAMERGALPVLAGYAIDPSAIVDLRALRMEWFDHVLRGAPLPGLLAGAINFEVMGADTWRHAATVAAMANVSVRLYPNDTRTRDQYGLTGHEPARGEAVRAAIRIDGANTAGASGAAAAAPPSEVVTPIVSRAIDSPDGAVFVSGPLYRPLEVSGAVSGVLRFAAPFARLEADLDLYALSPSGEYFHFLALPLALCGHCRAGRLGPSASRAVRRTAFVAGRLTSVELRTGTRIVLVLTAHARLPRRPARARRVRGNPRPPAVKWFAGTFVRLPVWRAALTSRTAQAAATSASPRGR